MHFVLLACLVVGRDRVATDQQSKRIGGVGERHTEIGSLGAVHAYGQLRLAVVEGGVRVHDTGNGLHLRQE